MKENDKKINDPLSEQKRMGHTSPQQHGSTTSLTNIRVYGPGIISFVMLMAGLAADFFNILPFFNGGLRTLWYVIAYLPVGIPVLMAGWKSIRKGDFFTEFLLMSLATLGAFFLGEYPEGVAVMLFYAVGELFQSAAVKKAKGSIKALLDVRPNEALLYRNNEVVAVPPETVAPGEKIQVRTGEKVPLDGELLSEKASLNTAAITGESKPEFLRTGETVYAGSINLEGVIEIRTTREFRDSSLARILDMVQNATARKSKTELFIRKFARIYTPIVVFLALSLTFLPYFFVEEYVFSEWLYRALIFLVISCPCALVISIPLGYFGGLGAASRNGILFKGASYLDAITKVNTIVMDKTGTLTKGVFRIKEIKAIHLEEQELMSYVMALEEQSTHPIARAILEYKKGVRNYQATGVTEIAGKGLKGRVSETTVLAGNKSLLVSHNIEVPAETDAVVESIVLVALDGVFAGYITIADELKEDARLSIQQIRKIGIKHIMMLSGDKDTITRKVAEQLGIDSAEGGLLPEAKLKAVEKLQENPEIVLAFIGDGINDAPVLAASDVGIAMGGLGSDVAVETADVVIQTDQPSKIVRAIKIGRSTRHIVWQNIGLAFTVKLLVLALGAGGLATMWEAVFADVGVALLAILNAVRLQRMQWR